MRILITGICGFVGSELALSLRERLTSCTIVGLDNLLRPGSEGNRAVLRQAGCEITHGDLRSVADVDALPAADWVIDAAACPSVLSGVDGRTSPAQLTGHNLTGTLHVLEYCRRHRAGLVMLSTSRVYSVSAMQSVPVRREGGRYVVDAGAALPPGCSEHGLDERFSTDPPLSLYGATKRASEVMAMEYGCTFDLPVWINRCGVLAGGRQFGTAEQGVFSWWVRAYAAGHGLTYLGYDGSGAQVRDMLHPRDLASLIVTQMQRGTAKPRVLNVGGGIDHAVSLAEVSAWCAERFGPREIAADLAPRRFDVPWIVMDSRVAQRELGWCVTLDWRAVLAEIADHHAAHPDWLALSSPS